MTVLGREEECTREKDDLGSQHRDYACTRSPHLREQLTRHYTAYVRSLARRFDHGSGSFEDLFQTAMEGFLRALERFEPDRGVPFPAFATPTIVGGMKRHVRDCCFGMRIPRWVHESIPGIRWATERLTAELGRVPLSSEVADLLGMSEAHVDEVMRSLSARAVGSLDSAIALDGSMVGDCIGENDAQLDRVVDRLAVKRAICDLSPAEWRLLHLYYISGLSQPQIADQIGVAQMTVSRELNRVMARLRARVPA